ncbi:hypothetical protein Q5H93_23870 [Hymenobacter sp. ASUV-10]|uniref:Secreted protein n=1 Tax=Hymenobacter aranciens TaxID=3063996 RepID=A0ABT9BJ33_9BACT|nr:hypothetical protein [Hymenobacter sp. ASUV-10]MDO7877795.1 hypothetical protein [Hymenobacter sp. ASUV-10]
MSTSKAGALLVLPAHSVTLMGLLPLAAPAGTTAVIDVAEFTTTLLAATPPKLTVAPLAKPVPVSTTAMPGSSAAGLERNSGLRPIGA